MCVCVCVCVCDQRHDEVLREIATYLGGHLSTTDYQMVADLDSDTYTFPTHICPTTERPDIVIGNEKTKTVYLIELTVCFDENFADASMRKQAKYHDFRETVKAAGHKCHLWTVQVGSRGIIDEVSFQPLLLSAGLQSKRLQTCTLNWQEHPYCNPSPSGALGRN